VMRAFGRFLAGRTEADRPTAQQLSTRPAPGP
jgi:hypothetical protein